MPPSLHSRPFSRSRQQPASRGRVVRLQVDAPGRQGLHAVVGQADRLIVGEEREVTGREDRLPHLTELTSARRSCPARLRASGEKRELRPARGLRRTDRPLPRWVHVCLEGASRGWLGTHQENVCMIKFASCQHRCRSSIPLAQIIDSVDRCACHDEGPLPRGRAAGISDPTAPTRTGTYPRRIVAESEGGPKWPVQGRTPEAKALGSRTPHSFSEDAWLDARRARQRDGLQTLGPISRARLDVWP